LSSQAITIGSISLQDFEVPTSVRFGGKQRMVIHRTSDGTRTIEPLGPDDDEICFEGIFSGANAETRARALDNLRLSGTAVWLTWQSFRYKIIVEDFSAAYHSRWWISYRLSCVVAHQSGVISSPLLTTQALILGALASAEGALLGTNIDTSALSSAVSSSDALTPGSAANSRAVTSANGSLSAVQVQIDSESEVLLNSVQGSNSSDPASSFTAAVGCSASLANAANARSYLGLICVNLSP
jgi:hypothetical protein